MSLSPARAATLRPVAVEPVNAMWSTWSVTAAPTSPPPATTRNRSAGSPASSSSSAPHSAVSVVCGSGLSTTALPATSAGTASANASVSG